VNTSKKFHDELFKQIKSPNIRNLWEVQNGYLFPTAASIGIVNKYLNTLPSDKITELQNLMEIGIQWNTEVTIGNSNHLVHQAFCSACPVSYSNLSDGQWENLGKG